MIKLISKLFFIIVMSHPGILFAENENQLRVTLQSSAISLDPGGIQDSQSLFVSRQIDCQLVRNQGSRFVLDAAESIKYINPLKIIIKINDKAKFHDGSTVSAEDVIASFNYIGQTRNIFKNFYVWVNEINSKDEKTIVIKLNKHIPQFLKVLSSTNFTIYKKSFLEKTKKNKNFWKFPLGCGGYRVTEFNNKKIKLSPINKGLPIIFDLITKNQLYSNEVDKYDIITVNIIGQTNDLRNFDILEMFDPLQFFVGLNAKSQLWKDKFERCKFLSNLDHTRLLGSYESTAVIANDLLPKGILGYNYKSNYLNDLKNIAKQDIEKSEKIKKTFCLSYLTVSIQKNKENEFVNMFKNLYLNIKLTPIFNVKKFGKTFVEKNCDAILFGLRSNYLDGYEYLTIFENNDANFSGLHNDKLSLHILKSQSIEDSYDRAKEYQKIIKEIKDLCIVRPLFTITNKKIYIKKFLKAPGIGLIAIHQYYLGSVTR